MSDEKVLDNIIEDVHFLVGAFCSDENCFFD